VQGPAHAGVRGSHGWVWLANLVQPCWFILFQADKAVLLAKEMKKNGR